MLAPHRSELDAVTKFGTLFEEAEFAIELIESSKVGD
jgi:hypothetical protein